MVLWSRWAWSRIEYHQQINKFLAAKLFQMFQDQHSNKHKISPVFILWNNTTVDEIKSVLCFKKKFYLITKPPTETPIFAKLVVNIDGGKCQTLMIT
jgi:hypothetical protein